MALAGVFPASYEAPPISDGCGTIPASPCTSRPPHRLAQPWGGRQLSEATRHRIRSPNIRQRVPTKGLHLRPGFPIEIKTPPYLDREGRPRKILPGVALLLRAADYLPLQVVEYREMKLRNCWMRLPSPMGIVFP